jgi:enamine deaminase RidA (YjgF/YER057c/UK114 family)
LCTLSSPTDEPSRVPEDGASRRARRCRRRVRREFFPKDFPASTGFAAAGLGDERWVIEVEAIAAVPKDSAK